MGRALQGGAGAPGFDEKPGSALATWRTPVFSLNWKPPPYLGGGGPITPAAHLPPEHPHLQQRVALPSCCMLSPCQADSLCARGGNRQQKLPQRPAGWRKHPAVLMVPWGCSWAQPVSFPNVSGLTNPSFLMGWCQGMEAGGKKSPSWALCPPHCRGHRAGAGPSSPELSKREAKPTRLISPLALRGKLLIGGWVDSQPECYYFPPEGIEPGMFFFFFWLFVGFCSDAGVNLAMGIAWRWLGNLEPRPGAQSSLLLVFSL